MHNGEQGSIRLLFQAACTPEGVHVAQSPRCHCRHHLCKQCLLLLYQLLQLLLLLASCAAERLVAACSSLPCWRQLCHRGPGRNQNERRQGMAAAARAVCQVRQHLGAQQIWAQAQQHQSNCVLVLPHIGRVRRRCHKGVQGAQHCTPQAGQQV